MSYSVWKCFAIPASLMDPLNEGCLRLVLPCVTWGASPMQSALGYIC